MLPADNFSRGWIDQQTRVLACTNSLLLEKAIVALQLIAHLVDEGLPFQFKGGTSLLLITNPIRRLSIDADIVTQASEDELRLALDKVAHRPPFTAIVHDRDRDARLPPKKHFRAQYPSNYDPSEGHVLLDVLFEPPHAARPTLIRTPFIQPERDVHALVPGADELLGDKLTAFAPKTIGILEHPDRAGDIVKQLFDVGVLFDAAGNLNATAAAYESIHVNQCKYRCIDREHFTHDETLDDTLAACLGLTCVEFRGPQKGNPIGEFLKRGVQRLQSHIVNGQFARDQSHVAAGKAAAMAAWLKRRPQGVTLDALRYNPAEVAALQAASIDGAWQPLNKLKKMNVEAFFHWWKAQQILKG